MTQSSRCSELRLQTLTNVIEAIYDCALEPHRWQETLCMIAELCRSHYGLLRIIDLQNGRNELTFHVGYDQYCEQLHGAMNPYLCSLQSMPVGSVATRAMLVANNELLESRFYQDLLKPQGIHDAIGFNILKTARRIGQMATHRLEAEGCYGDADVRLLRLLAPHICRSVAISFAIDLKFIRSEALEATLDRLATGVYLIDRDGRIAYLNCAAECQVRNSGALRIRHNRLTPVDGVARAALAKAIAEVTAYEAETPAGVITVALPDAKNGGSVAILLPLRCGQRRNLSGTFAATAAIFVQDPMVLPSFPSEAFAKLYGLTRGELRVLLAVSPGLRVKDVANMLGISETTAKTHLQNIHAKTGTCKRTELMRLLMSSTPPLQIPPRPELSSAQPKSRAQSKIDMGIESGRSGTGGIMAV